MSYKDDTSNFSRWCDEIYNSAMELNDSAMTMTITLQRLSVSPFSCTSATFRARPKLGHALVRYLFYLAQFGFKSEYTHRSFFCKVEIL